MNPIFAFLLGAALGSSSSKSDETGADLIRRNESDMEALGIMFSVLTPAIAIMISIGAVLFFGWVAIVYILAIGAIVGLTTLMIVYSEEILAILIALIARGLAVLIDPQIKDVLATCGESMQGELSSRLQEAIGEGHSPFVVDFQTSHLKDILSRHILADALSFVMEMAMKLEFRSMWGAIETAWEVAREFCSGKEIKIDFTYRKVLEVGSNKVSWIPAVMYFSGYQFISFYPGSGIYEAFRAEYDPPVIEVQLPGVLVKEVVPFSIYYFEDSQKIVWDWK